MKICPYCQSKYRRRMKRSSFLKVLIGTKLYQCENCHEKYIYTVFKKVIRIRKQRQLGL